MLHEGNSRCDNIDVWLHSQFHQVFIRQRSPLCSNEKVLHRQYRALPHGVVRNHCGNNDHPAVGNALSAIERINRTQLAMTSMECNTPLVTEEI
jgi:hypothetical protein